MREKEKFEINISEDNKVDIIENLREFCKNELDVEIGNIGADSLFDHIMSSFGKVIYNKAVNDTKEYYESKHNEIDIDSYMLLK
ncbi:MAG: DUF2164 family protein [Candidatus Delongbacteria bacterium]|nr:DUF2164 family protein [Candidatus Delongbacteria bacterium]